MIDQAADRRIAPSDRCLAVFALGRAPRAALKAFGDPLGDRTGDSHAQIRACAALSLDDREDAATLEGLLVDPSARVRAAAALALAALPKPTPALRSRLAWVAHADGDGRVRAAAHASARALDLAEPTPRVLVLTPADAASGGWLQVEGDDAARLAVPVIVVDGRALVLVRSATPLRPLPPAQATSAPYREDDWLE
ncbi:MAG: hypothetical protein R3B09_19495 [Nannocystaceae bacterium]